MEAQSQKKKVETMKKNDEPKYDVEFSMGDDQLTLVVKHEKRTHRSPISPKAALSLSNMLAKGAKFLGDENVS